jgi:hypothetical protein
MVAKRKPVSCSYSVASPRLWREAPWIPAEPEQSLNLAPGSLASLSPRRNGFPVPALWATAKSSGDGLVLTMLFMTRS